MLHTRSYAYAQYLIGTSILKIINFRDLNNKKLWNKFLVARANGITT